MAFYKGAREKEIRGAVSAQIEAYNRGADSERGYEDYSEADPGPVAQTLRGLAGLGLHGCQAEDIYKMLPRDEMEPAIEVMAGVRAYFQGDYLRI
jgi:hypothetical protein